MSEELKSAWEIALEKLEGQEDLAVDKLTEKQKQAIAGVRQDYSARIAEQEIGSHSRLQTAAVAGSIEEIEKIQQRLVEDKQRLNREMEKKIDKIRSGG